MMCGICGYLHPDPEFPVDCELLERMNGAIQHRGPDSRGYFVEKNIGMGMRRLAIIDVAGGEQPIANEDGTVVVVFNGEIYNFRELRVELESHGHFFKTASDTEVIVHAYEEWGDEALLRFNGMFASPSGIAAGSGFSLRGTAWGRNHSTGCITVAGCCGLRKQKLSWKYPG